MKAIMLAAGMGSRLYGHDDTHPHKALLQFGGKSLLHRHIDVLRDCGVEQLVLVVGYRAGTLLAEIERIGASDFVQPVVNPDYRQGTVVSLWRARGALTAGETCLFMDADVLYHPDLIRRLIASPHETCLLLDRDFEPGDEPVKFCLREGRPVAFGKQVDGIAADTVGEWPGFLKLSPQAAAAMAATLQAYVDGGRTAEPMESVVRDVMLGGTGEAFGWEDVTDLPWIEIDFPQDVERAEREILPKIAAASA